MDVPGGWLFSGLIGRDVGPGRVVSENSTSGFVPIVQQQAFTVRESGVIPPEEQHTRTHPSLQETN